MAKTFLAKKTTMTKKEIRELIIKELPRLIKKDREIRNFILDLTKERYAEKDKTEDRFDRILKRLEENDLKWWENQKKWEENQKKWEENQKRWEENQKRWEENQKRWEENQKVINQMLEEIKLLRERQEAEFKRLDRKFDQTIGALGARWGLYTEGSFRNALKAILEESFPVKVERYQEKDEEGIVFGRPELIELDLIIYNNTLILAEIKSSMSKADMHAFYRKIMFYEAKHNVKAQRKIVISPMVDPWAMKVAEEYGIEVYSYADDFKLDEEEVTPA